jgi:cell wall-associated NlpC family hydrolase
MPIQGVPLALVAGGAVLVYSGVENRPVADIFRGLAKGQAPTPGPAAAGPAAAGIVASGSASTTGIAIADDALQYKGAGYVWDGSPANGIGNWDCSSFVNWVCGHDLHLAIPEYPAGTYTGASHGPSSFMWAAWNGCTTIGTNPASAQAGDLCIWMNAVGHIGIAIGGGQMISALDTTDGTTITPISGTDTGVFLVRRLKAAITTSAGGAVKR